MKEYCRRSRFFEVVGDDTQRREKPYMGHCFSLSRSLLFVHTTMNSRDLSKSDKFLIFQSTEQNKLDHQRKWSSFQFAATVVSESETHVTTEANFGSRVIPHQRHFEFNLVAVGERRDRLLFFLSEKSLTRNVMCVSENANITRCQYWHESVGEEWHWSSSWLALNRISRVLSAKKDLRESRDKTSSTTQNGNIEVPGISLSLGKHIFVYAWRAIGFLIYSVVWKTRREKDQIEPVSHYLKKGKGTRDNIEERECVESVNNQSEKRRGQRSWN